MDRVRTSGANATEPYPGYHPGALTAAGETAATATIGRDTADDGTVREVVEALAPLERRAGSEGELEAARWLVRRLERLDARVALEEEKFLDGWAGQLVPLGLAGVAAGSVVLTGRARRLAGSIAAVCGAALADDVSNGTRLWRRATGTERTTQNVVAELGDPHAEQTLVVFAHHDAAQTGAIFDQSFQNWLSARFPTLLSRWDTSLPLWWPVVAGPALIALGAATRRRGLTAAGTLGCAGATALGLDIARSPVTQGANDNLSGVAAIVELAERLSAEPPNGLRVLLVSCGAEEVLQGGIYGFAARHFPQLDQTRTFMLGLDTVGSPELILLEVEGPFVMEDYPVRAFRDLIAHVAAQLGEPLRRGCRSRYSTDAVIPARAGYPTAMLCSWNPHTKLLANYHLETDVPENLDYRTVKRAASVVEAVARKLADKSASDT